MTVYIVHLRNHSDFHEVYTDISVAQQACYICNEEDLFSYWDITPIELTTDSFMELTLQPPNSKILSETVTAIVSDWNTIEPRFKLFGGTSGSLKYFTKVKPGTKLQITIKELK